MKVTIKYHPIFSSYSQLGSGQVLFQRTVRNAPDRVLSADHLPVVADAVDGAASANAKWVSISGLPLVRTYCLKNPRGVKISAFLVATLCSESMK